MLPSIATELQKASPNAASAAVNLATSACGAVVARAEDVDSGVWRGGTAHERLIIIVTNVVPPPPIIGTISK